MVSPHEHTRALSFIIKTNDTQTVVFTQLMHKIVLAYWNQGRVQRGAQGAWAPPSLPDFTEILPICLQLGFDDLVRLYLCSVKENMKLWSIFAAETCYLYIYKIRGRLWQTIFSAAYGSVPVSIAITPDPSCALRFTMRWMPSWYYDMLTSWPTVGIDWISFGRGKHRLWAMYKVNSDRWNFDDGWFEVQRWGLGRSLAMMKESCWQIRRW